MDNNYESWVEECGLVIANRGIGDPDLAGQYDDVLKFSNCWNTTVRNCVVCGGKEDNIDAVRGGNYYFEHIDLIGIGQNGITIKGGIDGYRIEAVNFYGRGKMREIEIGQFCKYDKWPFKRSRTTNGIISDCHMADEHEGKHVRVLVWNADKPIVRPNCNVKVFCVPKCIWLPYFLFRQFCVKYLEK